ncbi:branched-chain amino acid aminotransferase [Phialemonium atrogriseum]|uniref:Branched-chain amino acid aminotransferase n=1 Tax=Phialemonium atrogriseum TaxID=1093897 RepID=A0AAJ0C6M3_9PEZI|nr:branched-chain amino acid aminotransferase [Phialemonium atrogriseum]KAK1771128.1 branched-chain amino acid aminotransferase [Phialemonium atrogriseum]
MSPTAVSPVPQAQNGLSQLKNGQTTNGHLPELDASKLIYHYTTSPRAVPDEATACAGTETICTDHMITATWDLSTGWSAPELKPYGAISLMPTASVLHYATECFEGLKVYRGFDGGLRLFRPDCNAARMLMSTLRISLPGFPPAELERLLLALMAVDGPKWLPRDRPGSYLYLRPAMIGTQPQLGVQAPRQAMLFITASFMPRMDTPVGGMRLHTNPQDMVRAWVGGFGYAKVGANYGPSLLATNEARSRGYGQILWLYGPEGYCTEAGASNFFVVWRAREAEGGRLQLVTAPLDDRLILDGVTRRSVVQLARERLAGEIDVVERKYTVDELVEARKEGRLVEAFAAGTAFFICPVSLVHHNGQDVDIPMAEGESGLYTSKIKSWLADIMYGNEQHEWGVVVPEEK